MATEDIDLLEKLEEAGRVARGLLSTAVADGSDEAVIDLYDEMCQRIAATLLEYQIRVKALE